MDTLHLDPNPYLVELGGGGEKRNVNGDILHDNMQVESAEGMKQVQRPVSPAELAQYNSMFLIHQSLNTVSDVISKAIIPTASCDYAWYGWDQQTRVTWVQDCIECLNTTTSHITRFTKKFLYDNTGNCYKEKMIQMRFHIHNTVALLKSSGTEVTTMAFNLMDLKFVIRQTSTLFYSDMMAALSRLHAN